MVFILPFITATAVMVTITKIVTTKIRFVFQPFFQHSSFHIAILNPLDAMLNILGSHPKS